MPIEILLLSVARALVEVALLALLGQGALAVLAGKYREQNAFYRLLRLVASPAVRTVRFLTPRVILDTHVPWVAFFVLLWLWIGLALAKRHLCNLHGLAC